MAGREAETEAPEGTNAVVLLVDDEPDVASVTEAHLERHLEDLSLVTETSGRDALERFSANVDCVVSDYEMPSVDGLELLHRVRDRDPDLPFILFTARGSEEIASEAISAGVTDYLQKGVGTDQYAVLANRIQNAIDRRRSQAAAAETRSRYRQLVEHSPDAIVVHDGEAIQYANERAATLYGVERSADLLGETPLSWVHPEDRSFVTGRITTIVDDREITDWAGFRIVREAGAVRHVEARGAPVHYDGVQACQAVLRDVTDRRHHEHRLEALHDATRDLLRAANCGTVADIAMTTLVEVLDEPIAAIWRHDADAGALVSVAATDPCIELAPETDDPGPLPVLGPDVVEMTVFEAGEPRVVQNYADHGDATTEKFESSFLLPLERHGLLGVSSAEPREFTDSERDLIGVLARSVVAALDRVADDEGNA